MVTEVFDIGTKVIYDNAIWKVFGRSFINDELYAYILKNKLKEMVNDISPTKVYKLPKRDDLYQMILNKDNTIDKVGDAYKESCNKITELSILIKDKEEAINQHLATIINLRNKYKDYDEIKEVMRKQNDDYDWQQSHMKDIVKAIKNMPHNYYFTDNANHTYQITAYESCGNHKYYNGETLWDCLVKAELL